MPGQRSPFLVAVLIAFGLWAGRASDAQAWAVNGVPLSPDASNYTPVITSDGVGGSIVAWYGGPGSDIFASRLLANGSVAPGWPTGAPLVVCNATGLQEQPSLVPDGAGGCLIFWQDARNGSDYDIYAQHLDGSGAIVSTGSSNWIANGIPISTATGNQYTPEAVSDGAGGAIVVWQDGRHGAGNYDIYAQRVDGDGNLLWATPGIPICAATNNQINPTITTDGAGGAFIAWQDYRKGSEYDIYVQHVTGAGTLYPDPNWVTDGLGACVATNSQFYPVLSADGGGGVYVAWQDYRSGTDNHIFAQHLTAHGAIVTGWPANGSPVCQAPNSQFSPVVSADGGTGVFLAWQDFRSGTANHIYAQHLTSANVGWVADGIAVCTAINGQFSPQVAGDGLGGAFVTWYDSRNGSTNDIYIQQMNSAGTLNPAWDANGLAVCTAPNTQQFPVLVESKTGTSVVTWQDLRSGGLTTAAIYAEQAGTAGVAAVDGPATASVQLASAWPNPFQSSTRLRLSLPAATFVRAEVLDITGRRVAMLASQTFAAGVHELSWDGSNSRGQLVAPGVYLVRVQWPGYDRTQRVVRLR